MKTSLKSKVLVSLFLISAPSAHAILVDWSKCGTLWDKVMRRNAEEATLNRIRKPGEKIRDSWARNHIQARKGPMALAPVDWARERLRQVNKDPYPYVHLNEPLLAVSFAKYGFGKPEDSVKQQDAVDPEQDRANLDAPERTTEDLPTRPRELTKQEASINPEAIKADLNDTVKAIEDFPTRQRELIAQAANLSMVEEAFRRAKSQVKIDDESGHVMKVPYYKVKEGIEPDEKDFLELAGDLDWVYRGTSMEMKNDTQTKLRWMRLFTVKSYTEAMAATARDLNKLEADQAVRNEKIILYVHEIREQAYGARSGLEMAVPKDPYMEEFLVRTGKLFEVEEGAEHLLSVKLKPQYEPPYEAWTGLRWRVFFRQLGYLLIKKRETFKQNWWDRIRGTPVVEDSRFRIEGQRGPGTTPQETIISTLSERELRSLGLHNVVAGDAMKLDEVIASLEKPSASRVAQALGLLFTGGVRTAYTNVRDRPQWRRIAKSAGIILLGSLGGLGYGQANPNEFGQNLIIGMIQEWRAERIKRQECIEAKTEKELQDCLVKFIETKYPDDYLEVNINWDDFIKDGEIADESIRNEIETIKKENRAFQLSGPNLEKRRRAIREAGRDPANPLSPAYRDRLVKSSEETFKPKLLSELGYLAARHAGTYEIPEVKQAIALAWDNIHDKMAYSMFLAVVREREGGPELVEDFEKVLADHEAYLTQKAALGPYEKAVEDALKVDRGVYTEEEE
ncbi:MAG TPA: hypothetical protein VM901_13680 [Bdellovibrionota bacterium]|jgi:hypothetical protein|nr:hypothetical protein [Bdellovibrionota bacterium]